jgi:hypothetical protein
MDACKPQNKRKKDNDSSKDDAQGAVENLVLPGLYEKIQDRDYG